ncbi:MAG: hypothetical protein V2I51_06240, partial [Anderseniella sp.]|nr:hypothetical protein [Anderseniella sp.]
MVRNLPLTEADYPPMLRLGNGLPTAHVLPAWELEVGRQVLSPLAGGGDAFGTGNQNVATRLDLGIDGGLQLSYFSSFADDPLFSQPLSKNPNPANVWEVVGGAAKWQLLNRDNWSLAVSGSVEVFTVRSGGCGVSGSGTCSPNIFNNSGAGVSTDNVVGSLALPITWKASRTLELSFAPGVSFLPNSQGSGQGGGGTFYGNNITLGVGGVWRASQQLSLFGSALLPLGPGTNSFNNRLEFSRVPILTGGLRYALNPRILLETTLTNGFGSSPATA